MSLNITNRAKLQIQENLEGKKENILIIECNNCLELKKDLYKNEKCLSCFLKNLYYYKNKSFKCVSIEAQNNLIEYNKIICFLDYFKKLKKIKKIWLKIENIREKKCIYKDFRCKLFPKFYSDFKIKKNDYYNPILLYDIIIKKLHFIKEKTVFDQYCANCFNYIKSSIQYSLGILNELTIIKDFNNCKTNNYSFRKSFNYYEALFSKTYLLPEKQQLIKKSYLNKKEQLIDAYIIGKYELFQVSIFEILDEVEKIYRINLSFESIAQEDYFDKIIQNSLKNFESFKFDKILPLEDLIKFYKREAIKKIDAQFEFPKNITNKLGFFIALKKLNLEKLFPLLIDDFIEEIFLDSPSDEIYINHQTYGRCRTEISFNLKELERFKTLIRLYSGKRLDYTNPSIKHVIKNKYFYCRFAIDVEPLHLNNFALDIRKLNKNVLTIQDLLKRDTLNPLMAAFLFFCVIRRFNITVTGETDTGKTTFINALDLLTPKEYRKIYVENIVESLNQNNFGKHQLKYKVDFMEDSTISRFTKSNQIKTLLHRTPDLIYLGEILTKEEAEAMFHCLAAGLRGFQTIHANSVDSLINRFLYHFKINPSCLSDLDLIILMKKDHNKRRIFSISESIDNCIDQKKYYNTIFQYNPTAKKWDLLISLYETNILARLIKYEDMNEEKFNFFIKIYQEIFDFLLKAKKIDNLELTPFFHKISYYSIVSITQLNQFWNENKTKFSNEKIEV